ncbi:hypothetical protein MUK42_35256 [Musa troglodytarum]|uniref:Secreted protein n=1 Tax=Musa troglodytarum TaxID=320322 RepID=A0A9E7JTV5_9LILI|nr:hypothetical protein MUK42_35256 [Musa troglodytarum]
MNILTILLIIILKANQTQQGRCSIVVSIPACHAGNPGSIPGNGDVVLQVTFFLSYNYCYYYYYYYCYYYL